MEDVTKTGIDALLEYIRKNGESSESTLATELKTSEKVIESWADILEKANIVKINYKVGKMYIEPVNISEGAKETLAKKVETQRGALEEEINIQASLVNDISKKIDEFSASIKSAEQAFKEKAPNIKRELDEIEKIRKETDKRYAEIKSKKESVDKIAQNSEKEMTALREQLKVIQNFNLGEQDIEKAINDVNEKIKGIDGVIKSFQNRYETLVDEYRIELNALYESISKETQAIKKVVAKEKEELDEIKRMQVEYSINSSKMSRKLDSDKKMLLDTTEKAKVDMDKYMDVATKRVEEIRKNLEEMKNTYGSVATMNERMSELEGKIADMMNKKTQIEKDIEELRKELALMTTMQSTEKKVEAINSAEKKSQAISKKTEELREDYKSAVSSVTDDKNKK